MRIDNQELTHYTTLPHLRDKALFDSNVIGSLSKTFPETQAFLGPFPFEEVLTHCGSDLAIQALAANLGAENLLLIKRFSAQVAQRLLRFIDQSFSMEDKRLLRQVVHSTSEWAKENTPAAAMRGKIIHLRKQLTTRVSYYQMKVTEGDLDKTPLLKCFQAVQELMAIWVDESQFIHRKKRTYGKTISDLVHGVLLGNEKKTHGKILRDLLTSMGGI